MQLLQAFGALKNALIADKEEHEHELSLSRMCPWTPLKAGSQKAEDLLALEHLPHLFLSADQTDRTHHLQARKTDVIP